MTQPFLFIAGCPRSGTSFLQTLLIQHPDIALGLERFNLRLFDGLLAPEDFEPDRFFRVEPRDTWYDDLSMFAWHYDQLRGRYPTARYRGDKVPRAFEHFDRLVATFPDVRFVGVVRDVEDVAASYETRRRDSTHWNPAWDADMAFEHWNASMRAMLACADAAPFLPVVYEELVASPEPIRHIGEFLDLDPAPILTAWRRMRRDDGKRSVRPQPTVVRSPSGIPAEVDRHRRLVDMARHPAGYRRAWRTLAPPPAVVSKYFTEDARAFDYRPWRVPGSPLEARSCGGRETNASRPYVACIGSAATFGRLVERPFADQLRDRLGIDVVNLGFGGARPGVFADDEGLARLVRGAACVVVEAMSARGYATEIFTPEHAYTNMGRTDDAPPSATEFVDTRYESAIRAKDHQRLGTARSICRAAWVSDMKRVAALAPGRAVLLFISRRPPHRSPRPSPASVEEWTGGFPHHVDGRLLALVSPSFTGTVTVVGDGGTDDKVFSKHDGTPLNLFPDMPHPDENFYYPTRAMHAEAADGLVPLVRSVLARSLGGGRRAGAESGAGEE